MRHLRKIGVCAHCGREKPIEARGLCLACYQHQARCGTLEDYMPDGGHHIVRDYLSERQLDNMAVLVADLGYQNNPASLARLLHREADMVEKFAHQTNRQAVSS